MDSLISPATRIAGHLNLLSVSILCQDHEVLDGATGQTYLDVDAAKSLTRRKLWPMVSIGPWPAENSKTFWLTPVGVRFPLPAPFKIRYLCGRRSAFLDVSVRKLCQNCANSIPGTG